MKEIYVKPAIIEEISLDRKMVYAEEMGKGDCTTVVKLIDKDIKYS